MNRWTVERINEELNKISASIGDTFDIPVGINGRLTRTLGRVHNHCVNGVWMPEKMEFSRKFLEDATDESVLSVIQHEWAHYMVTKETGESHGHDATFKAMCARIGCANDKTSTKVERTVEAKQRPSAKYQVFCPTCEEFIGDFSRMCATLKNIDRCHCKRCGNGGLSYIQNW